MPTDDYIKRNDVKTAVFAWYVDAIVHHHQKYLDEVIAKIPAADVKPVVECQDCRFAEDGGDVIYCQKWDMCLWEMPPDAYCYFGKRKEKEDAEVR